MARLLVVTATAPPGAAAPDRAAGADLLQDAAVALELAGHVVRRSTPPALRARATGAAAWRRDLEWADAVVAAPPARWRSAALVRASRRVPVVMVDDVTLGRRRGRGPDGWLRGAAVRKAAGVRVADDATRNAVLTTYRCDPDRIRAGPLPSTVAALVGRALTPADDRRGLRVLQVTASPDRRGAEVSALQLGDRLSAAGLVVSTVAVQGAHRASSLPIRTLGRSRRDPAALVRLVRLARRHDVVVGHASDALWIGAVACRLARRPFVYRNIGDPAYWGRVRGAGLRVGLPLRMSTRVVALYEDAAAYFRDRYRVHPSRVSVLANPVDVGGVEPVDPPTRAEARSRLGLGVDDRVLGYLGALSPEKRPDVAIEVVVLVPDARLVMAGDGPMRGECERLAAAVEPSRTTFLGTVADIGEVLDAVDLLLVPSATEGMPAVVVEAAARGVPVVASAVGGIPGMVRGSIGVLVPPDAGAQGYAAAAEDLLRAGSRVSAEDRRSLLLQHDLDRLASHWAELLGSVARPSGTPPAGPPPNARR